MCTIENISNIISTTLAKTLAKQLVASLREQECEALILSLSNNSPTSPPPPTTSVKNCCKYVITRGEKKGQQCVTKVSGSETYCSKHKKTVNKDTKSKKKTTSQNEKSKIEELEVVEEELVITKDSQGRFKEPKSGFVFKDEQTIYGKADHDGNIVPLDKRDLVIVNMHGWTYTPSK